MINDMFFLLEILFVGHPGRKMPPRPRLPARPGEAEPIPQAKRCR